MSKSRNETLLSALANNQQIQITPITRSEKYLKACCDKCGCSDLPTPISRNDSLMYQLAENLGNKYDGESEVIT